MKRTGILSIVFTLTLVSGCATSGNISGIKVEGLDDGLENNVEVSTYDYTRPFLIRGGSQDWFFRGYLDKSSKQSQYQLYVIINSGQWMYWDEAKFTIDNKLISEELSRAGSDVDCSQYGCAHYEHMILHISRSVLKHWLKGDNVVRFSSSKVSGHRDINIDSKEVEEFLKKMDFVANKIKS